MALSCSLLFQHSCKLAPLSEANLSGLFAILLLPSSSLSALVNPGGGRLGGVGAFSFLRESAGASTREAGFHSVVAGAGG